MDIPKKIPDRLNVSVKARELVDNFDKSNDFADFGKSAVSRSDIFLFAMALGYSTQTKKELSNIYSGGLILDSSIDQKTKDLMYCQILDAAGEEDLESVTNKLEVYSTAEQFANAGFSILEEAYNTKKSAFDYCLELLEDLSHQAKNCGLMT